MRLQNSQPISGQDTIFHITYMEEWIDIQAKFHKNNIIMNHNTIVIIE